MRFKHITIMTLALLAASSLWAQVRETTYYDDGSYYTGQRDAKGRRHGDGIIVFANGDRYEGNWKKNNIFGHGVFRFPNGDMMEGEWTGMGTGEGYFKWSDGTRVDGHFVSGAATGQCIKVWPDGARYEGNFVQGHLSGRGKMKFADGSSYDGNWLNDQYEGEGTFITADGEVIKGRFHAGQLIEQNE